MTQSCCRNTALSTPKNMELPLGGLLMPFVPWQVRWVSHQALLWGKVLVWRGQQAQVGNQNPGKTVKLDTGSSETSYCPESLPDSQILTQLPGRTVQRGFLSAEVMLLCPTAHRGHTGAWTYLLQLPAVSFSRRTLFIFCINYSESWAGQETGEEEGRKEISYSCWVKASSIGHISS